MRKKVRIAFCVDSFCVGGTELNAVRTAESIDRSLFELLVIYFREDGPLIARYRALGVRLVHWPISSFSSPKTWVQCFRLAQFLNAERVDILHAHDVYSNIFGVTAARLSRRCKSIASRRWWFEVPRRELNLFNRFSYRLADRVLANCSAIAQLLENREFIPSKKIVEIPNFLDDSAFFGPTLSEVAAYRELWRVPDSVLTVGIVARLVPVKNHAMLLRALVQMKIPVVAFIVGDGPLRSELEQMVDDIGVREKVRFLGEVRTERNLNWYFDVAVLCSLSEGFPNSVIEAMAAARPIVATDVGGVRDAVQEGRTGFLVPSDGVAVLSEALTRLGQDPPLRAKLGAQAQVTARACFGRVDVMQRLTSIYSSLSSPTVSEIG